MALSNWKVSDAKCITNDFAREVDLFARVPNFRGVGFGVRGTDHRPCVLIQRGHHQEGCIDIPREYQGFEIVLETESVVSSGYLADKFRRAFGKRPQCGWPGWPGSAIRAETLHKAGTLGCYVADKKATYALVCEHVLSGSKMKVKVGEKVSSYVSSTSRGEILLGTIARLGSSHNVTAGFDGALVKIEDPRRAVNVIPQIGAISRQLPNLEAVALGTPVCKFGAASGYSPGFISAVHNITQERGNGEAVRLSGVMEISPQFDRERKYTSFCTTGDSGSVVVIDVPECRDVPVVGQLVARGTLLERGYVVGMERILDVFGVNLC